MIQPPTPTLLPGVKRHGRKFKVFLPGGRSGKWVYHGLYATPGEANAASRAARKQRLKDPAKGPAMFAISA